MRRLAFLALLAALALAGGLALAQEGGGPSDAKSLVAARQQAQEARQRSGQLEQQAAQAKTEADRASAEAAALAARIEAAEADITAAEARIRLIEDLRRDQRARLAEKQAPLIRLTAALQTMARRPPALALVQPGSLDDVVHVRALLASALPEIRARTAGLRAEVARGNALRRDADIAVAALQASQRDLRQRRIALAQLEEKQRARSATLAESAANEGERALALGERARDLAALEDTHQFQAELRASLSTLSGPVPRPVNPPQAPPRRLYLLPVEGRLVTGTGEISDAGVHARGLVFEVAPDRPVIAPDPGRIAYAGPFRSYGDIVVIDHGHGWLTAITHLGALAVKAGDHVARGGPLGRTGAEPSRVSVELRHDGEPVPITGLIG
ncbi:MAG TPA: peptidoglycan DD-metalloendopeptidase family protein [Allosphingosinicella sp.]|nr:peptidoglycan DD-metalloendopeptidase family protein [Allosphingosinicella sp.]